MGVQKSSNTKVSWILVEGDKFYLNTAKMAEIIGISDRTLRDWKTKGCPQAQRGWWDVANVIKWYLANQSQTDVKSLAAAKLEAEIAYKEAKITEQELKNAVLEGQYYAKDDVAIAWATRAAVMKSLAMELPMQIAAEFADEATAKKILQKGAKHVRNMIEAFCQPHDYKRPGIDGADDDDEDDFEE